MILLILFYLALVIAAGLLVAFGFSYYLKNRELSAPEDRRQLIYPPEPRLYRPLFAPSEEDIRAVELEEQRRIKEIERKKAEEAQRKKSVLAQEFKAVWLNSPDRRGAAELLRLAAESESAETFSEIAENVIKVWHDEKIASLSAADLADLLDSHFRLLPQQEKASGALFWLKQEIATLRREPEKNNLQGKYGKKADGSRSKHS